jgi:hypothetical protein
LGTVNGHLNGFIQFKVRKKGSFGVVRHGDGIKCGEWEAPTKGGNGQTAWPCHLTLFGQRLSAFYYESTHGTTQFRVHVGRIYFEGTTYDEGEFKERLLARANLVAGLMRALGWQLTNPEIKGQIHIAKENDPLAEFIPKGVNDADADITSDHSHGITETAMEGPTDPERVQIYANMPSAIKGLRQGVAANAEAVQGVSSDVESMRRDLEALRGVVELQASVLATLSRNVSALAEIEAKNVNMAMQRAQVGYQAVMQRFPEVGYQ